MFLWCGVGGCRGVRGNSRFQVSYKVDDGRADKSGMEKAKAERLTVNIAHQLRSFGFH